LHEMADDLRLPPAVVALWAADGKIPHIMRDGLPLFDPVAVGKHIAERLNNLTTDYDGNKPTTN
jgi:hypothetical protein